MWQEPGARKGVRASRKSDPNCPGNRLLETHRLRGAASLDPSCLRPTAGCSCHPALRVLRPTWDHRPVARQPMPSLGRLHQGEGVKVGRPMAPQLPAARSPGGARPACLQGGGRERAPNPAHGPLARPGPACGGLEGQRGSHAQCPLTAQTFFPLHLPAPRLCYLKSGYGKENHRQVGREARGRKVRDIYLTGSRWVPFSSLSPGPIGVRLRDI